MKKHYILIIFFFVGLLSSAINPHVYLTWLMEVFPAIIGLVILIFTFKSFQFSYLTYVFILIHCYILFIGGHYTYAKVPLFDWIKEALDQNRNNYDKVGHFIQGFVPAMIARELFIRKHIVKERSWLAFFTICTCVTISVLYEFLEWLIAIVSGESAESFLGTQGYVWDTQSDMLYAMIGAICMVLFLAKLQDKQLMKIKAKPIS
ncbi:DUF2238 domain-containing protein [Pedobacter arcticus]|uniref:DUF2238 domain-containing protein n=1 Tax=Pedobacter arcticus TaxID=752140 RepID=UPI0002E7EADF|nr:DUF2238 domain-containing protein [Pedobacter arcticus]